MYNYYLNLLIKYGIPEYLIKYLDVPSLKRLHNIGYFCGMDYASKDIYNFSEKISRFDHSISTALLTSKYTENKKEVLSSLFHDIATPCFSHVIDYMNGDYQKQESTEKYTYKIIKNDKYLEKCLNKDNISPEEISDFKNYSIVDTKRPKLCADRLDGIILTSIGWTKNITKEDIKNILDKSVVFLNENNEREIGFNEYNIAKKVNKLNNDINIICHSNEDNFMMLLLAKITKYSILKGYIKYNDLFYITEDELFNILENTNDDKLQEYLNTFKSVLKKDIIVNNYPKTKERSLKPIVNGKRYEER